MNDAVRGAERLPAASVATSVARWRPLFSAARPMRPLNATRLAPLGRRLRVSVPAVTYRVVWLAAVLA